MNVEKDIVDDLIDKLKNHEVPVDIKLFNSISHSIKNYPKKYFWQNSYFKWIAIGSASIITSSILFFNTKKENISQSNNIINNEVKIKTDSLNNSIENITEHNIIKTNNKPLLNATSVENVYIIENITSDDKVKINSFEEKNNVSQNNIIIPQDDNLTKNSLESDKIKNSLVDDNKNEITELETKQEINIGQFPNIFSPNNDGVNDYFEFKFEKIVKDFSITILDSQNKIVFQSNQSDFKWDGFSFNNNKVLPGKYIYFFTFLDENNNSISKSSYLQVVY